MRTIELGDTRLTYVVDGAMAFAPAYFFPTVPRDVWTAGSLLDAGGMVPMTAGGLLVEKSGRRLLVDAGLGLVENSRAEGAANSGSLPDTLALLGLDPADIDVLALTHLHLDHVGWAARRDGDGPYRKTFANARYVVAAAEWAAYPPGGGTQPLPVAADALESFKDALELVEDGDEVFPGVHAIVTPGHSPGHTSYAIDTGAERIIAFGDAFHHPVQLAHPEWGSGPDSDSDAVPAARERLIGELTRPGTFAFATHFGDQVFGRVTTGDGGRAAWTPVPSTVLSPHPRPLDRT
ncbi:MBL fold metallo-hydrolase [Amycolatopsis sp. NPDC088138]|uniref:MBL fold metallo-hydrolase n=1 Tax=Amycolatopsis sp. NPDC088138 TaxID=3363938 RepID=UPI0037F22EB1